MWKILLRICMQCSENWRKSFLLPLYCIYLIIFQSSKFTLTLKMCRIEE